MANSIKDFTKDKLSKMNASDRLGSKGDGEYDGARKADDFGMTAAGESNSDSSVSVD